MKDKSSIIKWVQRFALGAIFLVIILTGAFLWWGNTPLEAMPEAIRSLESDQTIQVNSGEWMAFRSKTDSSLLGIIIYPGGHVDPRAYAPLAKKLALSGNLVIIPRMPLNLAVFGIQIADEIIGTYPGINKWVIGGHSLGGAMAVEYVSVNPSSVDGLFLWASYFAKNKNLRDVENLEVLTIYGTQDSEVEKIRASRERLPQNTAYYEIEGANHAQFGWYGRQAGDGTADISREAQQELIFEYMERFLNAVKSKPPNMD